MESLTPEIIVSDSAPAAIGPYSHAIRVGGLLFLSGQIPVVPETGELIAGGVAEQTKQVISNIGSVLGSAGASFANVVKTTCFLTDMADFAAFNSVYSASFATRPARSCVAVAALPKGALVEIEAVAVLSPV
jgi:2-iminobutanoate/2-iminopropanoate deaminase